MCVPLIMPLSAASVRLLQMYHVNQVYIESKSQSAT